MCRGSTLLGRLCLPLSPDSPSSAAVLSSADRPARLFRVFSRCFALALSAGRFGDWAGRPDSQRSQSFSSVHPSVGVCYRISFADENAAQNHSSERGWATSVAHADALGLPRRSVLAFVAVSHAKVFTLCSGLRGSELLFSHDGEHLLPGPNERSKGNQTVRGDYGCRQPCCRAPVFPGRLKSRMDGAVASPQGERVVQKVPTRYFNPAGVPDVNFENCMVIAIFKGPACNSAGLRAVSVHEDSEALLFRFDDMSYQTGNWSDKVTVYAFFVLPRSTRPVVLEEDVQGIINKPPTWQERARFEKLPEKPQ